MLTSGILIQFEVTLFMEYYALHIFTDLPVERDLLTGVLENEGFSGFEEQDDRLIAYIPVSELRKLDLEEMLTRQKVTFEMQRIPETNWNALWEGSFSPVKIGDFCAIRASFHPSVTGVAHELIITPRMTFGTGHHSTTASMIRLMEDMDIRGKAVLDFGTGTGILAILATKMGAHTVVGVDNDPEAVKNAGENAIENNTGSISFVCAEEPNPDWGIFDRILINIQLHVILSVLPAVTQMLSPKGMLLVSGVLEENYPALAEALEKASFYPVKFLAEKNWVGAKWQKT